MASLAVVEQETNDDVINIPNKLWGLITLLKALGFLLVSKTKSDQNGNCKFYFKFASLDTFLAIFSQVVVTLGFYWISTSSYYVGNWVVFTLLLTGIFYTILNVLISWIRIKSTQKLLTGWNLIASEFETPFGCPLKLSGLNRQLRRLWIFYFKLPLCLFFIIGTLNFSVSTFKRSEDFVTSVFRIVCAIYVTLGTLALQLLYILVCHIMSQIYQSINLKILNQLMATHSFNIETILRWKTLFSDMQSQVGNFNDFISSNAVIMLVARVVSTSTSIYTVMLSLSNSSNYPEGLLRKNDTINLEHNSFEKKITGDYPITNWMAVTTSCVTICINLAMQLIDVWFAERICISYEEIVTSLSEFDTSALESDIKLQLKSLLKTLKGTSVKLVYYKTINVDRKLVIMVINASITYLIVLLQFKPL